MARILQIRRGTAAQNDNFTGLAGEVSFDMDNKTLRVHDGEKLGGYPLARAAGPDGMAGEFDINTVPDSFWADLFARFAAAPFKILKSSQVTITDAPIIKYSFLTDRDPYMVRAHLVCMVPQAGYAAGDECTAFGIGDMGAPVIDILADGRYLTTGVVTGGNRFWVADRNTGERTDIINAAWRIVFTVYC